MLFKKILFSVLLFGTLTYFPAFAQSSLCEKFLSESKPTLKTLIDSEVFFEIIDSNDLQGFRTALSELEDFEEFLGQDYLIGNPIEVLSRSGKTELFLVLAEWAKNLKISDSQYSEFLEAFLSIIVRTKSKVEAEFVDFLKAIPNKDIERAFIKKNAVYIVKNGLSIIIREVLSKYPDELSQVNYLGQGLLHIAVESGDASTVNEIAKLFVAVGIDLNIENNNNETPYDRAAILSNEDVKSALESFDVDTTPFEIKENLRESMRQNADDFSSFEIEFNKVKALISHGALNNLFRFCITFGCIDPLFFQFFKDNGIDLNLRENEYGMTPIMKMSVRGWFKSFEFLLTEKSVDLGLIDNKGRTVSDFSTGEFAYALLSTGRIKKFPSKTLKMFDVIANSFVSPIVDFEVEELDPTRILVFDDPLTPVEPWGYRSYFLPKVKDMGLDEVGFKKLLTKLQAQPLIGQLNDTEKAVAEYMMMYDISSYHGEMVFQGLIGPLGLLGPNRLEISNTATDFSPLVLTRDYLDVFGNEVIFNRIRVENPDVVSNSGSPNGREEKLKDRKTWSDFAESQRFFVVASAGNGGIEIKSDEKYSDYYFIVAAVDEFGKLVSLDGGSGSNFGDATFAAPSYLDLIGYNSGKETIEVTTGHWGATSYSTPQGASLIGKVLNRLPKSMRYRPDLVKAIILETGDFSEHLVGKITNPVVINEQQTIEFLDSHLIFEKLDAESDNVTLRLDKRVSSLKLVRESDGEIQDLNADQTFIIKSDETYALIEIMSKSGWKLLNSQRLSVKSSDDSKLKALFADSYLLTD